MSEAEWPLDTSDCVFLGRATAQINQPIEILAQAIETGKLDIRARLVGAVENRLAHIAPTALTPEGWIDAIQHRQIEALDRRPWVPVQDRRRIPQPHWLFVTRNSLNAFLRPSQGTAGAEHRAIEHLRSLLAKNPQMSRREAKAACEDFALTDRGFLQRVWPEARKAAQLSPTAPAGKKPRDNDRRANRSGN